MYTRPDANARTRAAPETRQPFLDAYYRVH